MLIVLVYVILLSVTGMERESVEHFLFRCSKHQSARTTMLDTINDIRISSKEITF